MSVGVRGCEGEGEGGGESGGEGEGEGEGLGLPSAWVSLTSPTTPTPTKVVTTLNMVCVKLASPGAPESLSSSMMQRSTVHAVLPVHKKFLSKYSRSTP